MAITIPFTGAAKVDANVDFRNFAPYLGVGYDGGRGKKGFSFFAEAGAMFQGKARLTGKGSVRGTGIHGMRECNFTFREKAKPLLRIAWIALLLEMRAPLCRMSIKREHEKLNDKLKNFKVYPVVALGVIYRF